MKDLIACLRFEGDLKDDSKVAHRVINHNVQASDNGAVFNGRDSYLEIPSSNELNFGREDFTIAAEIYTEEHLDDVIGDIVSKYDDASRKGFNLTVKHHAGVVSTQSNYRNVHFGIDDDMVPLWQDCGRAGNAVVIAALAVYEGKLYAGTYEPGKDRGHVYRYEGGQEWTDLGSCDKSNKVSALAVYQGKLYAATQKHDGHGSLLPLSQNCNPGGSVFRFEGQNNWIDCGRVCEADNLLSLVVHRGRLYTSPMYTKGIYRYEGGKEWSKFPSPDSRLFALAPYHGYLYATANRLELLKPNVTHAGPDGDPDVQKVVGSDGVYRYKEGIGWEGCGKQDEETQIYASVIHKGQIYVGTWPHGTVFRHLGGDKWQNCGRLGNEEEVMGLNVYNGRLYAGTLPTAEIYRFDGDGQWKRVGRVDWTPDAPLRRALSMVVYQGRLFAGTLPSGRICAMEVGKSATYDYELDPGWKKICAVKGRINLKLFVDGRLVASSTEFDRKEYDLSNEETLKIGFGQHDYFNGKMKNFRIFNRALSEKEILEL